MRLMSGLVLFAMIGALYAVPCRGCVGARPLALGGAFVALADDVNATYWNPAGLAQMKPGHVQGTFTHTDNNRNIINYQEYAAVAGRLPEPLSRGIGAAALGFSYVETRECLLDKSGRLIEDDQRWFWLSAAIPTDHLGMIGANLRVVTDSTKGGNSMSTDPAVDIGYLYRADDRFSIGLLIQNANRPTMAYNGKTLAYYARNYRPGIAYRPTRNMVLVLDEYDAANEARFRSFRAGAELTLGRFALRGGYYGFGGTNVPQSATFGVGMNTVSTSFDAAVLLGDLENTVMLGIGFNL